MENYSDIFVDDVRNSIIFHIPHSGLEFPFYDGFICRKLVEREVALLTDHSTDKIFNVTGIESLVFPYSRVFCDVERLDDEDEIMFEKGRGFFYTKTDSGRVLRGEVNSNKEIIYRDYYLKHHAILKDKVQRKLDLNNICYVIDCHSFTDTPFESDLITDAERPDICIGTDDFHTPAWLSEYLKKSFQDLGFSVSFNSPYSGTLIPMDYYLSDERVKGVMIEINRKLYMDGVSVIDSKVELLNSIITKIFEF